jgi:hypothetical protein
MLSSFVGDIDAVRQSLNGSEVKARIITVDFGRQIGLYELIGFNRA